MRQNKDKIRITVIESSPILLSGVVHTIKNALDCDVAFQQINKYQQAETILDFAPDIIIANPTLLGIEGIKLLKQTIEKNSAIGMHLVCLLTTQLDPKILSLFEGMITLYDEPKDIHQLIDRLSGYHERFISQDGLTEREKQIIRLVVKGKTNKEISKEMNISVYTVSTHRRNIAKKLQIHSATAMTIFAISNNLVSINEVKI